MSKFKKISSIDLYDQKEWEDSIYLTFDIDWASDDVLNDTIDIVESANIAATWFVTHKTPVLNRLRANSNFELGIHPNFNELLEGNNKKGNNSYEVLERVMNIVPDAISVRSHSLTSNSKLSDIFKQFGLLFDINEFIPYQSNIRLRPWKLWNDMVKVPFFWEDDVYCLYDLKDKISNIVKYKGIKVLNFHPMHVYLNTYSITQFNIIRKLNQNKDQLIKSRHIGDGTREKLIELIKTQTNGN